MRLLSQEEMDAVSGGTFRWCLPKKKVKLSWCKPRKWSCKPPRQDHCKPEPPPCEPPEEEPELS